MHATCPSILEKYVGGVIKQWDGRCYIKSYILNVRKMKGAFFVQKKAKLQLATLFDIPIRTHVHNTGLFKQTMRCLGHDLAHLG